MAHTTEEDENELAWVHADSEVSPLIPDHEELVSENKRLRDKLQAVEAENFHIWRLVDGVRTHIRSTQAIMHLQRELPQSLGGHATQNMESALYLAIREIGETEEKFNRIPF